MKREKKVNNFKKNVNIPIFNDDDTIMFAKSLRNPDKNHTVYN